jgi:hypothetical protein
VNIKIKNVFNTLAQLSILINSFVNPLLISKALATDVPPPTPIVLINEIKFVGSEWVEIINVGTTEIDLTGWKIRDDDGYSTNLVGTINPNTIFSFDNTSEWINNDNGGDTVILQDNNGVSFDAVTYLKTDGSWIVNGENLGSGEAMTNKSFGRVPDRANNWEILNADTKGISNVPPAVGPTIDLLKFDPQFGTVGIGSTVKVTFKVGTTPGLSGSAVINGHSLPLSSVFGGEYDAFYVVTEGDTNIGEGETIPISVELWNQEHTAYSTTWSTRSVDPGIDATRPVCNLFLTENPNNGYQHISGSTFYYAKNNGFPNWDGNLLVGASGSDVVRVTFPNVFSASDGSDDTGTPFEKNYYWNKNPDNPALRTLDGTGTHSATCFDGAGNITTTSFVVAQDNNQPILSTINLSRNAIKPLENITVTTNGSDVDSGIYQCLTYISNNNSADISGDILLGDLGTDCQETMGVGLSDGQYYIKVKAGDNVGYWTNPIVSEQLVVDSLAPQTTDDAGEGTQTFINSKLVNLTATDNVGGSGIDKTFYCVGTQAEICTPTNIGSSALVTCPGEISCSKILYYKSVDRAGNEEGVSRSHLINVLNDLTPPTTSNNYGGKNGVWQTSNQGIGLTATDDLTGVAETKYCVDETNSCTPTTDYSGEINFSSEGNYYLRFFSKDNTGNQESIKLINVKIDKTDPNVGQIVIVPSKQNSGTLVMKSLSVSRQ